VAPLKPQPPRRARAFTSMSQQNLDFNHEFPARGFEDSGWDVPDRDATSFAYQDFTFPQFASKELGSSVNECNGIKYINPVDLVVHRELTRIYGSSGKRLDLQSDIETNGIIVPLVVSTRTPINTIVSGACRNACAMALGMESIPIVCYEFPSEEAEKHFILSANRNRPKTKYQQLLEGKEWELLEKQAAALRRREGLSQRWKDKDGDEFDQSEYYPPTLLPDYRTWTQVHVRPKNWERMIDKVGSRIGMSGKSYQRAKPIIEKCELLRSRQQLIEADSLESYLESAGIVPASDLLKSPNCDAVLALVAGGEAANIKEALIMVGRINKTSAVIEGAIFFFPDKMLRKPTYFHLGRVVKIANMTATVSFRDGNDYDLHLHQYKCDELLSLTREEEEPSQIQLRDRMTHLLSNPCATPTDQYVLNRLLSAVTSIPSEINYLEIIESLVADASKKQGVEA
jgi:hypothetical protein